MNKNDLVLLEEIKKNFNQFKESLFYKQYLTQIGSQGIIENNPIRDITETKELQKVIECKEQEINRIQKRFQILIRETSDVFEIISSDGTIKYISEAAKKVIGYRPEELMGKNIFDFCVGKELQKAMNMFELVLNGSSKKVQDVIIFRTKKGESIYLEVHMHNLLHEPAIDGIAVNFRDVTKRVEMENRMAHISTHDELTGLPNRVYFTKQLKVQSQYAKEKGAKFALMMLDIDGLKYINYSLGYELSDQLIIQITQRLKILLGQGDIICRYSEDHFAVIVQELSTIKDYENIAEGIIEIFSRSYKVDKYELDVSVNIGVCIYSEDAQVTSSLRKNARSALHRAKQEGKNRYKFYSSVMDIQNHKEFILRNDLYKAIEDEQLRVYYQPVVNLKTSKILAAESLIRWEHPDWGVVSPNEFIPLAEETGLIMEIGKWILRKVCSNYKKWLKDGLPAIKVSVNFSSIQFFENNFVDNIKNAINEFDLEPHFLIMEITESLLMKNTDKIISDIKSLKAFGIQVALDDFGTGFSSLAYLNSLSIDILKIDGSFIKKIPFDKTSTLITRSIINLAQDLKIKLIAERIENLEQLLYLKELNCNMGQGFMYSKPVNLEDFEKILAKGICKPVIVNFTVAKQHEDRRKYSRIKFPKLLEADLTIEEIKGKKMNLGITKVLVKDIGPGGLCFISNIKFPVERGIVLQFVAQLIEKEIKVSGYCVWKEEIDDDLTEYGIELIFDESDSSKQKFNQVQAILRDNISFAQGRFVTDTPATYFSS